MVTPLQNTSAMPKKIPPLKISKAGLKYCTNYSTEYQTL